MCIRDRRECEIPEVLHYAWSQLGKGRAQPESYGDAGGVRSQPEHEKQRLLLAMGKLACFQRVQQGLDRSYSAVGVIALAEEIGQCELVVETSRAISPEHRGSVADLHAISRAPGEQVVERGRVS